MGWNIAGRWGVGGNVWVNARVKRSCGVKKKQDKRINEYIIRCFGNIERTGNNRIAKKV